MSWVVFLPMEVPQKDTSAPSGVGAVPGTVCDLSQNISQKAAMLAPDTSPAEQPGGFPGYSGGIEMPQATCYMLPPLVTNPT